MTPAHIAAFVGDADVLDTLGHLGAPLDVSDLRGTTFEYLLWFKAKYPDVLQPIEYLFEVGDKGAGFTPAHWAAFHGHVRDLNTLHRYGVPLNITDSSGTTPAQRAASKGQLEALTHLMSLSPQGSL